ncbi:batten's disease protein Cln3 [Gautieria morchelliformis]|nr:batten's disease protein Cln3 [Gautieria morchelliformis]
MVAHNSLEAESLELRRVTTMATSASHHQDDPNMESSETLESASLLLKEVAHPGAQRKLLFKLGASFFLFGLINNVLYVIILSAALDLVPPSTPKGIIAFCNIAPSLIAKLGWPYILKGRIRYRRRLIGCCFLSVLGMLVVSAFDGLSMRLLGIALASFSSGLGELTFLQLSTTYHPLSVAGHAVGYFASGTGGAGLVGAGLWWFLRSLGVRLGIGLSSVLPLLIPVTYMFLLPSTLAFACLIASNDDDDGEDTPTSAISSYVPIPTSEGDNEPVFAPTTFSSPVETDQVALTPIDKWTLVRPLLLKFMLPLSCVYLLEYTINQGIAPTLVYPVPSPMTQPFLSHIITSIRDYYPLWQVPCLPIHRIHLTLGSLAGNPPLPSRLLSLPAIVQAAILVTLVFESASGIFDFASEEWSIFCVFLLISVEGICGGLAYVNTFYHVGQQSVTSTHSNPERARQEREFKIGSIGFSDSLGILCASIIAVPTEVQLCKAQVRRGKMFCTKL